MRRAITSMSLALALLLAASAPMAIAVEPPANDDLADAMVVSSVFFAAAPEMAGATMEANEPACDETGGLMDQSVWYAWTFPVAAGMQIEINGTSLGVTAAVFGPFDVLPTQVEDLPQPMYCIYGTGPDQALTESYEAGTYLVQLTTVSSWDVTPSIRIEQQPVHLSPWAGDYEVDVQAGVPIVVRWGWAACSRGLATVATNAFRQSYTLWQMNGDAVEVLSIGPDEAATAWGDVFRTDAIVDSCAIGPGQSWDAVWAYSLPQLEPGTYVLETGVVLIHSITDGAETLDGDGRPDLYPGGLGIEGSITINVLAVG